MQGGDSTASDEMLTAVLVVVTTEEVEVFPIPATGGGGGMLSSIRVGTS